MKRRLDVYSAGGMVCRLSLLMGILSAGVGCGLIPETKQDGGLSFQQGAGTSNLSASQPQGGSDSAVELEKELLSTYYVQFSNRLDEEVKALRESDANLESQIADLRAKLDEFEVFVRGKITELESADQQIQKDMENLEAKFSRRMEDLEADIEEVSKIAKGNTEGLAELKNELIRVVSESAEAVRKEMAQLRSEAIEGVRNELEAGLATAAANLAEAKAKLDAADAANKAAAQAEMDKHLAEYAELKENYQQRMAAAEQKIVDLGISLEKQAKALEDYKKEAARVYLAKKEYEAFIGSSTTLEAALSALKSDLIGKDGKSGLVGEMVRNKFDELQTILVGEDGKSGLVASISSDQARKQINQLKKDLFGADGKSGIIGDIQGAVASARSKIERQDALGIEEVRIQVQSYKTESNKVKTRVTQVHANHSNDRFIADQMFAISIAYQPVVSTYKELIQDAIQAMKKTYGQSGDQAIIKKISEIESDFAEAMKLEIFTKSEIEKMASAAMARLRRADEVATWANNVRSRLGRKAKDFVDAFKKMQEEVGNLGERMDSVEGILQGLEDEFKKYKQQAIDAAVELVRTMDGGLNDLSRQAGAAEDRMRDIERRVAKNVNDISEGKLKQQALQTQHDNLVKSFAKRVADEKKVQDMNDKMLAAQDALEVYLRAKSELVWKIVSVLSPSQDPAKRDYYDEIFRSGKAGHLEPVYGSAQLNAKCDIQPKATFANAGSLDAHLLLAYSFVEYAVKGQLTGIDQILHLDLGKSLLDGKTPIQQMAMLGTLEFFPAVEDETCRQRVDAWAQYILTGEDIKTALASKGTSIWELLNADKSNDGFKAHYMRFKQSIEAYANRWKGYQDALTAIDADLTPSETSQFAANLIERKLNEYHLKDLNKRFEEFRNGVTNVVGNLSSTDNNVSSNARAISDLQSEMEDKLRKMDQTNAKLDDHIKSSIDEKLQSVGAKTERMQSSLLETIKVVATMAQRLGYGDLVVQAQSAAQIMDKAFTLDPSKMFVKPKITNAQHMFGDLYYDAQLGYVTNPDGSRYDPTTYLDGWSQYNQARSANYDETCGSASLGLQVGTFDSSVSGLQAYSCWVNFRAIPLSRAHDHVVENVMFRLFGSAEFVHVQVPYVDSHMIIGNKKLDARDRIYLVSQEDETRRHAEKYIAEYLEGNIKATINNPIAVREHLMPVPAQVQGSDFMGAFDIRDATLLDRKVPGATSTSGVTIKFKPVRYMTDNNQYLDDAQTKMNPDYGQVVRKEIGEAKDYHITLYSPIVLDFMNAESLRTSSQLERPVQFDLDGNGVRETVGWVNGLDGSFLVVDLNENGKIDSGRELFGQATQLPDGRLADNGYEALKLYDTNMDGIVDKNDRDFDKLKVWSDSNHDGISQGYELQSLADVKVSGISVRYKLLGNGKVFDHGNWLKYQARFFGPETCGQDGCKSYDVFFGSTQALSQK